MTTAERRRKQLNGDFYANNVLEVVNTTDATADLISSLIQETELSERLDLTAVPELVEV